MTSPTDSATTPMLSLKQAVSAFIKRNAFLMASVFLFVTFWMLIYSLVIFEPSYSAKSVVIIKDSAITGSYLSPGEYYKKQTTTATSSNPVLNTMEILKSQDISDSMWMFLNENYPKELEKNNIRTLSDWDTFFQDGSSFIKAKHQSGTDLITVKFSWRNPRIAQEGLAVILETFQESSRNLNKQEQTNRTKFLEAQVGDIESQLALVQQQKSRFQQQKNTINPGTESALLATTRTELRNKLNILLAKAEGKDQEAARYESILGTNGKKALQAVAIGQNTTMAKLQDKLYLLEETAARMRASLTDENPKVIEIQEQINQVKTNLQKETKRSLGNQAVGPQQPRIEISDGAPANTDSAVSSEASMNSLPADTETQAASRMAFVDKSRSKLVDSLLAAQAASNDLRAQITVIQERLDAIDNQIQNFPEIERDMTQIQQRENQLSEALDRVREKLLEGQLKENETLSNVFIMDRPHLPLKPKFPNRTHMILISVAMGAVSAVLAGFLKDKLTTPTSSDSGKNLPPGPGGGNGFDEGNFLPDDSDSWLSPIPTPQEIIEKHPKPVYKAPVSNGHFNQDKHPLELEKTVVQEKNLTQENTLELPQNTMLSDGKVLNFPAVQAASVDADTEEGNLDHSLDALFGENDEIMPKKLRPKKLCIVPDPVPSEKKASPTLSRLQSPALKQEYTKDSGLEDSGLDEACGKFIPDFLYTNHVKRNFGVRSFFKALLSDKPSVNDTRYTIYPRSQPT
ncbi:MAG: hypothetical protein AAGI66_08380 [Cyanobacteria bacterium P01_H01_bin.74]